jgi:hypothetical protein
MYPDILKRFKTHFFINKNRLKDKYFNERNIVFKFEVEVWEIYTRVPFIRVVSRFLRTEGTEEQSSALFSFGACIAACDF